MTNKEFRLEIYKWLFDTFKIKTEDLTYEQKAGLKKALKDFNPEKPMYVAESKKITKEDAKKMQPGDIIKISEWKPYKG